MPVKKKPKKLSKRDAATALLKSQKSEAERVRNLSIQKEAIQLKINGVQFSAIAEHFNVDIKTAKKLVADGLDEYYADHNEIVHRYIGLTHARYERIIAAWFTKAVGGRQKVRQDDGSEAIIALPPDREASRIILETMRDCNKLFGYGETLRVEHTGNAGGPIITAAVDSMDAARAVREVFGGLAARGPMPLPASPAVIDAVVANDEPGTAPEAGADT